MNLRFVPNLGAALALVLVGPLALPADAQAPSEDLADVQGAWIGTTAQTTEFQYRLFFEVERKDGEWTGYLDAPARRIADLPVAVSVYGDSIRMETTQGLPFQFTGRLASAGKTMTGTLKGPAVTGGQDFSLTKTSGEAQILADPFAEPFRGITSGGVPREKLFPIRSTGISTEPIVDAADTFLHRLDSGQRQNATFSVDSGEWRHWTNSPFLKRRGVSLRDMSEKQRAAAFDLIRAGLSARGFPLARDIMRVEDYISRLIDNRELFGEHLYHVTVMGEPSTSAPWGWQLDGHHLIVNFFVLGDQVVMTPSFFGSEPTVIDSGRYAGTEVLQDEQDRGLAFLQSISPDQREAAILDSQKTGNTLRSVPYRDNLTLSYAGLKADQLSTSQREELLDLIRLYVGRMREGHAKVRMEEVRDHFDETHFAWIGDVAEDDVYYYRIHSPVLLIEFDHAGRQSIPGPAGPTHDHIHTVIRTPNGGDYGRALLKKHYEAHKDNPDHQHRR